MPVFIPLVPNWDNGVRDTYEFKTGIFTSHDGTEQRRSDRIQPRRSINVAIVLDGERLRVFNDCLIRAKDALVQIPDFTADPGIIEQIEGGILLERKPDWMTVGAELSVISDRWARKGEITSLSDDAFDESYDDAFGGPTGIAFDTDTVEDPEDTTLHIGDVILPVTNATVKANNSVTMQTNTVGTVSIEFAVLPGVTQRTPSDAPITAASFLGRYVLTRRPNWLQRPSVQFSKAYETVDYDRGVIKNYNPSDFISRTLTATYLGIDRASTMELLDIFLRCKGRAGEIFVPSWSNDFPSVLDVTDDAITLRGESFFDTYSGDPVHQLAVIRDTQDRMYPIELTTWSTFGGNTVIYLNADVPVEAADIVSISWLFVARFAQDSLTLNWQTNSIANVSLSFTSLQNLPVEQVFSDVIGQWIDSEFTATEEWV